MAEQLSRPGRLTVPTTVRRTQRLLLPGPVPRVGPIDTSNAVLFLASDEARYVTGLQLKVDAGSVLRRAYLATGD
jgi:NAD(P)-dependent dehydrogenase (short-subunit alcohol dehydrogenase family)